MPVISAANCGCRGLAERVMAALLTHALAGDGHSLQLAVLAGIVTDRLVLGRNIIPDQHLILPPAHATAELRAFAMSIEEVEDRFALLHRQAVEAAGEDRVDEDEFAAGGRMRANYRMQDLTLRRSAVEPANR